MDERVIQFRIGVMVLATALSAAILITMFSTRKGVFRPTKTIMVHFREAPGVSPNTPVRKNGILIGRVSEVALSDEMPEYAHLGGALVTLEIEEERKIYDDEDCWIRRTLLGDAVIEFVRRREPPGKLSPVQQQGPSRPQEPTRLPRQAPIPPAAQPNLQPPAATPGQAVSQQGPAALLHGGAASNGQRREIEPGGPPLEGRVATDPLQFITELQLRFAENAGKLAEIVDQTHTFVARLNILLGTEEDLQRTRQRFNDLVERTNVLVEHADKVVGDEQLVGQLRRTIDGLPELVDELRRTADTLKLAAANVNLRADEVSTFTQSLRTQGPNMVAQLDEASQGLAQLLAQTNLLLQKVHNQQGTMGRLVHDSELYDHLNGAAAELEELLVQMRPIMRDLRVFSDRIARHPEMLGVRGAVERSQGTKGVPSLSELQGPRWSANRPTIPSGGIGGILPQ